MGNGPTLVRCFLCRGFFDPGNVHIEQLLPLEYCCEKCYRRISCSNCGLNVGALVDSEGNEVDFNKPELYQHPAGRADYIPALEEIPLKENHEEEMKSLSKSFAELVEADHTEDLFTFFFSVVKLRKSHLLKSDQNRVISGDFPLLPCELHQDESVFRFSTMKGHRILCKICLRTASERHTKFYFSQSQRDEFLKFRSEDDDEIDLSDVQFDSIVSVIGYDALGNIFSFLKFPISLSYLSLVCKNWHLFFTKITDFQWMTRFYFPDPYFKILRAINAKSTERPDHPPTSILEKIDRRFLGVYYLLYPLQNIPHELTKVKPKKKNETRNAKKEEEEEEEASEITDQKTLDEITKICSSLKQRQQNLNDLISERYWKDVDVVKYMFQFFLKCEKFVGFFNNNKRKEFGIEFMNRTSKRLNDSSVYFLSQFIRGKSFFLPSIGLFSTESSNLSLSSFIFQYERFSNPKSVDIRSLNVNNRNIQYLNTLFPPKKKEKKKNNNENNNNNNEEEEEEDPPTEEELERMEYAERLKCLNISDSYSRIIFPEHKYAGKTTPNPLTNESYDLTLESYYKSTFDLLRKAKNLEELYVNKASTHLPNLILNSLPEPLMKLRRFEYVIEEFSYENLGRVAKEDDELEAKILEYMPNLEDLVVMNNSYKIWTTTTLCLSKTLKCYRFKYLPISFSSLPSRTFFVDGIKELLSSFEVLEELTVDVTLEYHLRPFFSEEEEEKERIVMEKDCFLGSPNMKIRTLQFSGFQAEEFDQMILLLVKKVPNLRVFGWNWSESMDDEVMKKIVEGNQFEKFRANLEVVSLMGNPIMKKKYRKHFKNCSLWLE